MDKIREEFEANLRPFSHEEYNGGDDRRYAYFQIKEAYTAGSNSRDPEIAELHESCNNYKKMNIDGVEEVKKLQKDNDNYRKRFMEKYAEVVRLGSVFEELKVRESE